MNDYYSKLEPTQAQLSFVKSICNELNIDEPEELTRKSYSNFIAINQDKFYSSIKKKGNGDRIISWR